MSSTPSTHNCKLHLIHILFPLLIFTKVPPHKDKSNLSVFHQKSILIYCFVLFKGSTRSFPEHGSLSVGDDLHRYMTGNGGTVGGAAVDFRGVISK